MADRPCGERPPPYHWTVGGLWWMRLILVALVAVLAVVLIARHNVLIGGLLLAITGWRLVMIVTMQRRWAQRRDRFQDRRGRWRGPPS